MMVSWHFDSYQKNKKYKSYGPYDTKKEAEIDIIKIRSENFSLHALNAWYFSMPYEESAIYFDEIELDES